METPTLSKGVLIQTNKQHTLRFSMSLPLTREQVWNHFIHPEQYTTWLRKATLRPVKGGHLELHYRTTGYIAQGTITRINPGHFLEHTWEDAHVKGSMVQWTFLEDEEETCLLILEHSFPPLYNLAHLAAGWHLHLELLASTLAAMPGQWSWEYWEKVCGEYEKDFYPS
ncbi:MAG TPA: SRPBCC domain-containing protein [Bacteroidia bacterium]|nr:SRPBCC domain-containing protein [Bacteroidia bacterium]